MARGCASRACEGATRSLARRRRQTSTGFWKAVRGGQGLAECLQGDRLLGGLCLEASPCQFPTTAHPPVATQATPPRHPHRGRRLHRPPPRHPPPLDRRRKDHRLPAGRQAPARRPRRARHAHPARHPRRPWRLTQGNAAPPRPGEGGGPGCTQGQRIRAAHFPPAC